MAYYASYLVCSTGIFVVNNNSNKQEIRWIPDEGKIQSTEKLTPQLLAQRSRNCFELLPKIGMKHLVLINGNMTDMDTIALIVEEAASYAKHVSVVTSVGARIAYAMHELAIKSLPRIKPFNFVLVVSLFSNHCELHFVERDKDGFMMPRSSKTLDSGILWSQIDDAVADFNPEVVLISFHRDIEKLACEMENICSRIHKLPTELRQYQRWDYMLQQGGYSIANQDVGQLKDYPIGYFSNGLITQITCGLHTEDRILLPPFTPLPTSVKNVEGVQQITSVHYTTEYMQLYREILPTSKRAVLRPLFVNTNCHEDPVFFVINEYGIPLFGNEPRLYRRRTPSPKCIPPSPPALLPSSKCPASVPSSINNSDQKESTKTGVLKRSMAISASTGKGLLFVENTSRYIRKEKLCTSAVNPNIGTYQEIDCAIPSNIKLEFLAILSDVSTSSDTEKVFHMRTQRVESVHPLLATLEYCLSELPLDIRANKQLAIIAYRSEDFADIFMLYNRTSEFVVCGFRLTVAVENVIEEVEKWNPAHAIFLKPESLTVNIGEMKVIASKILTVDDLEWAALKGSLLIFQNKTNTIHIAKNEVLKQALKQITDREVNSRKTSPGSEVDSKEDFSDYEVSIVFKTTEVGVEFSNGSKSHMLSFNDGGHWLPLYVSFVDGVYIGIKAKEDYGRHPQSVVFDLVKIITECTDLAFVPPEEWKFQVLPAANPIIVVKRPNKDTDLKLTVDCLLAMVLRPLVKETADFLQRQVTTISIKVPLAFGDAGKAHVISASNRLQLNLIDVVTAEY